MDGKISCPICGRLYSIKRNRVLIHLKTVHKLSHNEAQLRLGNVCAECAAPMPVGRTGESAYCSAACGRKVAGCKNSAKRKAETEDQKQTRLAEFYTTLEAQRGWAIAPKNIEAYVKGLGFVLDRPYTDSRSKLSLICQNGHKFERRLVDLRGYPTCTICNKIDKFYTVDKVIARMIELGYDTNLDPSAFENGIIDGKEMIAITCDEGHTYQTPCMYILRDNQMCPICNRSQEERGLYTALEEAGEDFIHNDRSTIPPFELDFLLPGKQLAIEMNGLYWHSEKFRPSPSYHRNKMLACAAKGLRLITIFTDEWHARTEICISRVQNAAGMSSTRIGGRQCSVVSVPIPQAIDFFEAHHLQGRPNAMKKAWGLVYDNNLIQCIGVGELTRRHTANGRRVIEIKRMATVPFTSVAGGFSKLMKRIRLWAVDQGYNEIRSYCDLRWGTGNSYNQLGFVLASEGRPTYWYTDRARRYSAYSMRKTPEERITGKTEREIRLDQGYLRIWDCGHQTWSLFI